MAFSEGRKRDAQAGHRRVWSDDRLFAATTFFLPLFGYAGGAAF